MTSPRPTPARDLDTAPWWAGTDSGELLVQKCARCARLRWPPRPICNECHDSAHEWVAATGRGTVESWTATYHSFGPAIDVPFLVVLVRLEDQPDIYMPGYFDGPPDGRATRIGQRVSVGFVDVDTSDGTTLRVLQWVPDAESADQ